MMRSVIVNVGCALHEAGHDVSAWTTTTAGLVVHAPMVCPDGIGDRDWCVTHARSGGAVARVSSPEEGQYVANLLGYCGNWDRPAADIVNDEPMADAAAQIQRSWPAGGGRGIRSVPERMTA